MTAPTVTLTFDNGPTAAITGSVLDILAAHSVPATFFVIGRKLATPEGRDLARRSLAEGHRLGGHTWTHSVQFGPANEAVISDELERTRAAVDDVGGDGLLFRPYGAGGVIDHRLMSPFGASTLCSQGYTCVLWNVLPGDWRDPDGWVDQACAGIDENPWSVVVLHDVVGGALHRLDEFLTAARCRDLEWSQDFPDECVPIRNGTSTPSFDTLCLAN